MSTVLRPSRHRRAAGWLPTAQHRPTAAALLGFVLAAALGVFTFVTGGGTDLASNTWAEIALTLIGLGLVIAAVLGSASGRLWGGATLLLFLGLTAFTALSIAWSVQPANSWVEASRTVSYLAAFGGAAALARLVPGRWASVAGAVAAVTTVVCGYALLAKVFPASLDAGDPVGRLRLPFDYWNAVGLMAALGVPACLWAGARREGAVLTRTLAVPALGILGMTLMLSLSRGALVAAVIGVGIWFVLVPLRLRAAAILTPALIGIAAVCAWALGDHPLVDDNVAEHARTTAGHHLGLLLLAMVVVLAVAGLALVTALDRRTVAQQTRRRVGIALVVLVSLFPLAGIVAVAGSSRGLTGNISHLWNSLTSPNSGGATDLPGRLVQLGSTRGRYWNEAIKVGEHALAGGAGAGGFATAAAHYTETTEYATVDHAHGYLFETFADLGLIGVALSLALLIAWGIAAWRSLDWGTRATDSHAAERAGLSTMFAVAIIFGLNSAIDWTWFVPGTTVTGLICAGWLAGRGPLSVPIGLRPAPAGGARSVRDRLARTPSAIALVTAISLIGLVVAWMVFQPLRSSNADGAGVTASLNGAAPAAIADASAAATYDPVSVDPLFELAALYQSTGDNDSAEAELLKAIALQPNNPNTWLQNAELLIQLHRPDQALRDVKRAGQLDIGSSTVVDTQIAAEQELKR